MARCPPALGAALCLVAVALALLAAATPAVSLGLIERTWDARQLLQEPETLPAFPPPGNITGVRLVNGSWPQEGRLEVQINGSAWSSVCSSGFTDAAAHVACSMLNSSWPVGIAAYGAPFGEGQGPVLLTYFSCGGSERSLFECGPDVSGKHNECKHENDVGVVCLSDFPKGITAARLVNGSSPLSGRLEVQIDHLWWGTVCASVDNLVARAACRGMGHPYGRVSSPWNASGPGSGAMAISTLTCPAGAQNLNSCDYNIGSWDPMIPWTRAAPCGHSGDVSIECFDQPPDPINGIRLANGTANSGRLEVRMPSYGWGTVSWGSVNKTAADVACRQLGFPAGGVPLPPAVYGPGSGPILLDKLICSPYVNEPSLDECNYSDEPSSATNDSHDYDVGLHCFNDSATAAAPITGLRLVNGSSSQGALQVQLAGMAWGSACSSSPGLINQPHEGPDPDIATATVICRSLGHSGGAGLLLPSGAFGANAGPFLVALSAGCRGNETSLNQCDIGYQTDCNLPFAAVTSVACLNGSVPAPDSASTITAVRLVNGSSPAEGRLEVLYHGAVWGTACSRGFDATSAAIACSQAGFSGSGTVLPTSAFGPGAAEKPILLGSVVHCDNASLASLADCSLSYDASECDHSMDVGLSCLNVAQYSLDSATNDLPPAGRADGGGA